MTQESVAQGGAGSARPTRTRAAVGFVMAATFVMAFQDAIVKFVSADLPLWQIFTLRSLIAIALLTALLFLGIGGQGLRPRAPGWVLLRGALLVAMYVAFYAALPFVELSVVAAAYYTGPLFIALFAALLIGERLTRRQGLGILLGFAGVLVILQPGGEGFSAAMLIPIASAVFYALAMVLTRGRCVGETAISLSIALNLCFIACGLAMTGLLLLANLPPAAAQRYPFLLGAWVPMGAWEWGVLGLLALLNVWIHLMLARAYQTGVAPVVASFDYSYLVFAVLWGYLLLAELPTLATLVGMAMIAAAGLLSILRGRRARPVE